MVRVISIGCSIPAGFNLIKLFAKDSGKVLIIISLFL